MFEIIINVKDENEVVQRCMRNRCGLGKSRENLVQLRGWKVAGIHAEIEERDDGLYVSDKVDAGTHVNGKKIDTYGPLLESDIIGIGAYSISARRIGVANVNGDSDEAAASGAEGTQNSGADSSDMGGVRVNSSAQEQYIIWQSHVHEDLLKRMDLKRIDIGTMSDQELRSRIESVIHEILDGIGSSLPAFITRERLAQDVLNEAVGLGPLEQLLADETVTEVMVNAYNDIYVERKGVLQRSDVVYSSHKAVLSAIERIVSPLGRRIDESSPMVDARLKDGSRVNAIIPPLALKGPCITIRKFSKKKLQAEDLINFNAVNTNMMRFLKICVEQKKNIVISGGTGSGKTTLLNVLSNYIPRGERVITIEDAAELQLAQPHLVSLEARPPNMEGKGAITIRELLKNCLRMRPDRIVVGECRGGEALDMLQAMNTGHDGSLTTGHANSPRDMISRLEVMVMMAGMELPIQAIREQVASSVNLIVQISRFADGSRRVTHINELTGMETGIVQMQEIFKFQQEGYDENNKVKGRFMPTGRVPEFYEDMRNRGLDVDMSLFS